MSNTFKLGDRVRIEGYGLGTIRNITSDKVFVEFTNPNKRQYAFKMEELTKIDKENGSEV